MWLNPLCHGWGFKRGSGSPVGVLGSYYSGASKPSKWVCLIGTFFKPLEAYTVACIPRGTFTDLQEHVVGFYCRYRVFSS